MSLLRLASRALGDLDPVDHPTETGPGDRKWIQRKWMFKHEESGIFSNSDPEKTSPAVMGAIPELSRPSQFATVQFP